MRSMLYIIASAVSFICYERVNESVRRNFKRRLKSKQVKEQVIVGNNSCIAGGTSGHVDSKVFSKQLLVIFVLRKICDIPSEQLVGFLKQFPSLEEWITFCGKCSEIVESCAKRHKELLRITAKFNGLKSGVVKSIIESSGDKSCRGSRKRKSGGGAVNGYDDVSVTEKSRKFVIARNAEAITNTTKATLTLGDNGTRNEQSIDVSGPTIKTERLQENVRVAKDNFMEEENQTINCISEDTSRLIKPAIKTEFDERNGSEEGLVVSHEQVNDNDDQEWLPGDGHAEENDNDSSSSVASGDPLFQGKDTLANDKKIDKISGLKRKRDGGRRHHKHGTKNRPTMQCPLCKKFNCRMAKAEDLCNHLHGKCPTLKQKNEDLLAIQKTTLCCPLCRKFKSTVGDMVDFANHMGGCLYSAEEDITTTTAPSTTTLGHRIFTCHLCSENKYMKLEDFVADYLRHQRRKYQCCKNGCDKKFSNTVTFRLHWKREHAADQVTSETCLYQLIQPQLPEIPWWCPICQHQFKKENERDSHVKTMHPQDFQNDMQQQQHKCKFCEKMYSCPDELKIHEGVNHMAHSRIKVLQCSECTETFSLPKMLLTHRKRQHGLDLAKCGDCGMEYRSEKQLKFHVNFRHGNPEEASEFTCLLCQKAYSSSSALATHAKQVHNPGDGVTCEHCGKWCSHNGSLKSHMIYKHNMGGDYKCSWKGCDKSLQTRKLLQYHLDRHKKTPQFKCKYCSKEFYFPANLKYHENDHENPESKPFQCSQCPLQFARRGYLTNHVKNIHINPKRLSKPPPKCPRKIKFPCPKCEMVFPKGKLLQAHNAEAHPFSMDCEICDKKFATKQGLRMHRKNSHEKRFEICCEICGMGQLSRTHLKAHLCRAHQIGEYGMHKCSRPECEKVFYSKGMLLQHMAQHNKQPLFKCEECDKEFYFKGYLRKHLKKSGHGNAVEKTNVKDNNIELEGRDLVTKVKVI